MDLLLEYQKKHTETLINIIRINRRALDSSDTGTGKNYSAIAICHELNLIPFIICVKTMIQTIKEILIFFGIKNITLQHMNHYRMANIIMKMINCVNHLFCIMKNILLINIIFLIICYLYTMKYINVKILIHLMDNFYMNYQV